MKGRIAWFWRRVGNELAEAVSRYAGLLPVPLGELGSQSIAEGLELSKTFVNGRKVLVAERQHARTWRFARTRELENLGDLPEGEAQRLGVLDETKLLDRVFRVPAVPRRRPRGTLQQSN
jgi:hypothetical protein